MANIRHLALETGKEILKEVFHARPSDVEDMIQRRLKGKGGLAKFQESALTSQIFVDVRRLIEDKERNIINLF